MENLVPFRSGEQVRLGGETAKSLDFYLLGRWALPAAITLPARGSAHEFQLPLGGLPLRGRSLALIIFLEFPGDYRHLSFFFSSTFNKIIG